MLTVFGDPNSPHRIAAGRTTVFSLSTVLLSTLPFAPASAQTSGVPTAAELAAKITAAAGPAPPNIRQVTAVHVSGLDGTATYYRTALGFRAVETTGPLTAERGVNGTAHWHQNYNGQTVVEQPDPSARVAPDRYVTTVTRVTTPLPAIVLSHLTERGDGTRTFVDPQTYDVVRIEEIRAAETDVTTFDDFRTTGGSRIAWHRHVSDGTPADDSDFQITSRDLGAATDADVAIPASRSIVTFPSGAQSTTLPVSEHFTKFVVRIDIGGHGLDVLLDSGASGIELDDDVARSIGLDVVADHKNSANAGTFTTGSAVVPKISIGTLTMTNVRVGTIPHVVGGDSPGEFKTVGLLGFDFIEDAVLALDYEHETVTAFDPATFAPPNDRHTLTVPVRLGSQIPMGDMRIDGDLGQRFVFDTGAANAPMLVFDYFARRYPDAVKNVVAARDPHFSGVGGAVSVSAFNADTVDIASIRILGLPFYRVTGASYGAAIDGLIGPQFLRFFTVYLDYARSSIYLVPNSYGKRLLGLGS